MATETELELRPLSQVESKKLNKCEEEIASGMKQWYEVGNALLTIRDEKLYRGEFPDFSTYCASRWNITSRRAYQMIEESAVARHIIEPETRDGKRLPPPEVLPETGRQVRPLAELNSPAEVRKVWNQVVDAAPKGLNGEPQISGSLVEKVVATRLQEKEGAPNPDGTPYTPRVLAPKEPWFDFEIPLEEVIMTLHAARKKMHELARYDEEGNPKNKWCYFITRSGVIDPITEAIRHIENNRPAEIRKDPPGFAPNRSVVNRNRIPDKFTKRYKPKIRKD